MIHLIYQTESQEGEIHCHEYHIHHRDTLEEAAEVAREEHNSRYPNDTAPNCDLTTFRNQYPDVTSTIEIDPERGEVFE
jgi:hypothetical protein